MDQLPQEQIPKQNMAQQNPIPQFTGTGATIPTPSVTVVHKKKKRLSHIGWWIAGGVIAFIIVALIVLIVLSMNHVAGVNTVFESLQNTIEQKSPALAKVTKNVSSVLPTKTKTAIESFVSAVTAESVEEKTGKPVNSTTTFKNTAEKYFLIVQVSEAPSMNVKAVWYQDGKKVQEYVLTDVSGNAAVSFYLDVSKSPALVRIGDYKVVLLMNDQQVTEVPFHVVAE